MKKKSVNKYKTYSYTISDKLKEEMIKYFSDKRREKTPAYAIFQADEADTVITLYESNKVVFQGLSSDIDADMWRQREKALTGKYPIEKKKDAKDKTKVVEDTTDYYFINSIGSDEVGTGDYFGPIVVTAAYVNKDDINYLEALGVKDSKKLTDEKILNIAPLLIKRIPHVTAILTPLQYNNMYSKEVNMNAIKAIMHNKVLYTLITKQEFDF